jgi:DNA (cytosine-5)-methyltransferase 1
MPERPVLLDLFCKAGGAGKGYADAGFEVVGVDIEPQPHYPFRFVCADALTILEWVVRDGSFIAGCRAVEPVAVHASPPCQASSSLRALSPHIQYPELIPPTRELLVELGLPYVIENVVGAKLHNPVTICGTTYCPTIVDDGKRYRIQRHRLFETNFPVMVEPCTCSPGRGTVLGIYGGGTRQDTRAEANPGGGNTSKANKAQASALMGIDWMTRTEMCQAIPPAYTEAIGAYLMRATSQRAVA